MNASLWSDCTSRAPPEYGITSTDYIHICDGWSDPENCKRPGTKYHDLGLGVQAGDTAPQFSLPNASDYAEGSPLVSLNSLLAAKPKGLFLQFGSCAHPQHRPLHRLTHHPTLCLSTALLPAWCVLADT